MFAKTTILGTALVIWSTALVLSAGGRQEKTTNDGIYTKEQADGAKAQFEKLCAECHAFTVAAKKKPKDVPLGDEPFMKKWDGRTLDEMVTTIVLTMPNDGSAVVTDAEAVGLVAYILQQNAYPAGSSALTKDLASTIVLKAKQ